MALRSLVRRFALEAFFEEVAVAPVLSIIIVHVGACYSLHCLAHALFALTDEQVEVVRHKAVGVVGAVASAGVALIVVAHSHPVKGVDALDLWSLCLQRTEVVKDIDYRLPPPRSA